MLYFALFILFLFLKELLIFHSGCSIIASEEAFLDCIIHIGQKNEAKVFEEMQSISTLWQCFCDNDLRNTIGHAYNACALCLKTKKSLAEDIYVQLFAAAEAL